MVAISAGDVTSLKRSCDCPVGGGRLASPDNDDLRRRVDTDHDLVGADRLCGFHRSRAQATWAEVCLGAAVLELGIGLLFDACGGGVPLLL